MDGHIALLKIGVGWLLVPMLICLLTVLGYDNPGAQNLLLTDREAERADPSIGPGCELATYRFRHR